jgi:hypothetical protein
LSNPFKTVRVGAEDEPFVGKRYPTYFKFEGKAAGTVLHRNCHVNRRCRIAFETDVVNDYFGRSVDPGQFSLYNVSDEQPSTVRDYSLNLRNGVATLNLRLPPNCLPGDELRLVAEVTDRSRAEPYENSLVLSVKEAASPPKGGNGTRRTPAGQETGDDREAPSGIQLPRVVKVYRNPAQGQSGWKDMEPIFDQYNALRVIHAGTSEASAESEDGKDIYDFFLNVDNVHLKTEQKSSHMDADLLEARFLYGMVLLGLGVLHQEAQAEQDQGEYPGGESNGVDVTDKVEEFTKAAAPVLLPMIDYLGSLDLNEEVVVRMSQRDA